MYGVLEMVLYMSGGINMPKWPWQPPPSVVWACSALAYFSCWSFLTACAVMAPLGLIGVSGLCGRTGGVDMVYGNSKAR